MSSEKWSESNFILNCVVGDRAYGTDIEPKVKSHHFACGFFKYKEDVYK